MMNYLEAVEILSLHCGVSLDSLPETDDTHQKYLVTSLYYFKGKLIDDTEFQRIKNAIYTVYINFNGKREIDRNIMSLIFSIIYEIEIKALRERSYLRRNNLISEPQLDILRKWKDEYSKMLGGLLDDKDPLI